MSTQSGISLRIEEIVEKLFNGNQSALAKAIGVNESNIRSYIKEGRMPKADVLEKIANKTAVSCDWLLMGRGQMTNEDIEQVASVEIAEKFPLRTDRTIERQRVPLYPYEATAGVVAIFTDMKPIPLDYITLPDLPPVDGAVYVRGDSMYPLLKSGDIVLYKTIADLQYGIFYGEMYLVSAVIDGEVHNTVKYVQRSDRDGFIRLVSHNIHHDPKEIPLTMVRAMAIIKASIRYNTM